MARVEYSTVKMKRSNVPGKVPTEVTPVETQPTCGDEIPGALRRGSRKKLHSTTI